LEPAGGAVAQSNTTTANVPMLTLNNGVQMPQFGLGVYSLKEGDETYNSVLTALKDGYRHIDTAHAYQNERSVGRAIKDSGIPRDSIWITSKLWPNEYGEGVTQ
jgi:diketogulonate reductase-like aldo/keto reductase